jgi:hypothetical protein
LTVPIGCRATADKTVACRHFKDGNTRLSPALRRIAAAGTIPCTSSLLAPSTPSACAGTRFTTRRCFQNQPSSLPQRKPSAPPPKAKDINCSPGLCSVTCHCPKEAPPPGRAAKLTPRCC